MYLNGELVTNIDIPKDIEKIGSYVFYDYKHITNLVIPDNVLYITNGAFSSCENLESVTIGNGVKEIGEYAFYHCKKLTNCKMGENVERIETCAFEYCPIENFVVPNSLTYIGIDISRIKIQNLYISDVNVLFDLLSNDKVGLYCENLYINNELISELTIPDGVTEIYYLILGSNIQKIVIPSSVTFIYGSLFYDCKNLTDVYYLGTYEQMQEMTIYNWGNEYLLNATWHYSE